LAADPEFRWTASDDLFGDVFPTLPPDKCGAILAKLAESGLVSVFSGRQPVDLDSPMRRAVVDAAECSGAEDDTYHWRWSDAIHKRTGDDAADDADLLNTISIAAYAASVSNGSLDEPADPLPAPNTRFLRLPNRLARLPAYDEEDSDPESSDCRPDIISLPSEAFYPSEASNEPYLWRFKTHTNMFTLLRTHTAFKPLFGFCSEGFTHGRRPAGSIEGLDGKALAIRSFEEWYHEQEARDHLDLRYVCWPMVEGVGAVRHRDKSQATTQELGYMCKQLRAQPWLRFAVGWFATDDLLGTVRADPIGVEQCVVNRWSSRGALETVRFALGFTVATHGERGHHPAFTLERVDVRPDVPVERNQHPAQPYSSQSPRKRSHSKTAEESSSTASDETSRTTRKKAKIDEVAGSKADEESATITGVADSDDPAHPDIRYSRHIRFITLAHSARHYPKLEPTERLNTCTQYFVHHLVHNRRSVSGRSARVFCVSREVTADDPDIENQEQWLQYSDEDRKFIGVYALKLYYAPHSSECYKEDLIGKARQREIKTILLPTRYVIPHRFVSLETQ
jgi:hypothetical protein